VVRPYLGCRHQRGGNDHHAGKALVRRLPDIGNPHREKLNDFAEVIYPDTSKK
jgi:hypothetical protein